MHLNKLEGTDFKHDNSFSKVTAKKNQDKIFSVEDLKVFLPVTSHGLYYTSLKSDCYLPKMFLIFASMRA